MSDPLPTLGAEADFPPRRRRPKGTADVLKEAAKPFAEKIKGVKVEPVTIDHSPMPDPEKMSDIDRAFFTGEWPMKTFGVWQ